MGQNVGKPAIGHRALIEIAADQLADRLARSGVNLVRLGDLDSAYGPDRSLFDDAPYLASALSVTAVV